MVLVGPSGCGKTTALRMVAGLEAISQGTVRIGDRVVNDVPPKERDIAMVFQNYALVPAHDRVRQHGVRAEAAEGAQGARSTSGCSEAARILGLDELLDRKPKALSGGQRQRVAMGRAIVRHPQAFLMDEPLSNLDAKLRVQMRSEIARIQHDLGVTTIYVTHDQTEAMTMGDRVAVIRKGELQQVDTPADALRAPGQPVRRRVHRLAGDEPVRRHARRATATALAVEFGGFRLPVPDEVARARARRSRGYAGRTIVLGIRPEDMEDAVARVRRARRPPHHARPSSCARRSAPTSSCTSRIDGAAGDDRRRQGAGRRRRPGGARAGRSSRREGGRTTMLARLNPRTHGRARASRSSWWSTPTACTSSIPTTAPGSTATPTRDARKIRQQGETDTCGYDDC